MLSKLTDTLPTPRAQFSTGDQQTIGIFPGEGIGPEVVAIALDVLKTLSKVTGRHFELRFGGAIGRDSLLQSGKSLTDEAISFCESVFNDGGALFCGAGGARFVYDLRLYFDLFCKFTPLVPHAALHDVGIVRAERLRDVDIVAVRENAGGLYFGKESCCLDEDGTKGVSVVFGYHEKEIRRILTVAMKLAEMRRGRVCIVVKLDGIPVISGLWVEEMNKLRSGSSVEWEVLDIDNATYQLIADPQRFDVIVSPNMFGDVLADCGALLLGTRGLSFSGNFSPDGKAVYQTGHGAAYDLAGKDVANPVGQIMALAMMLEESFCWQEGAQLVRQAVSNTLAQGIRTADMAYSSSLVVGSREMGRLICRNLEKQGDYL